MKKSVLLIVLLINLFQIKLDAQDYKAAVGIRFPNGPNFKYFLNTNTALDFSLGLYDFRYGGMYSMLGLLEIHKSLVPKNLRLFYGVGGSTGSWSTGWTNKNGFHRGYYFGINGVVGLEYSIKEIPICISIDILPGFNLINEIGPTFGGGFTIRYILSQR